MLINIVLLFLVFGATKKKFNPYAAAATLGAVKGGLYFLASQSLLLAAVAFGLFGGLAAALVFLLAQLDRKELSEDPYPKYGGLRKSNFKWEYVPLSVIVLCLIFGEFFASLFLGLGRS
ncbi:hypothetical protein ESB00_13045 [Oleiharenicola lentus]|jgi:hypothetical protein|uniref:Uncharacterized protein n=1 Tax=Oleiharenicola lentus TaxID=2508720 RepID=A0A4Q1CCW2_9BACT|nr:hypothetical protein ESB00_13045 [Oleiharenicola lentus]